MSDWIEWSGGPCPVSDETKVEIRMETLAQWTGEASEFSWVKMGDDADITEYRIIQETPIATTTID